MVRAGNGLRGHLLQAMVQARQNGGGHGKFGAVAAKNGMTPNILQRLGLGRGVGQREQLQALLQRVGAGHSTNSGDPNQPDGLIHGFGPGGSVTAQGGHDPVSGALAALGGRPAPDNFKMPPGLDPGAANAMRNDGQHAHDMVNAGNGFGGAQQWEAHHPAAVAAGHIPNWVMEGLTNALHAASGGMNGLQPTHIQDILQHLSGAMAAAQGGGSTMQPPPQSYS